MNALELLAALGIVGLTLTAAGRLLMVWVLPVTEVRGRRGAWCQGCDRVRWAHQMSWTDVGTLRCPTCYPRRTP